MDLAGEPAVGQQHDPVAAAYADRVVLLADGRLAGEVHEPTTDSIINALRGLGA